MYEFENEQTDLDLEQDDMQRGKNKANASLVLGIVSLVGLTTGIGAIISIICGIIGLVLANESRRLGFKGGTRTAGFVLSLIGLVLGLIITVACVVIGIVIGSDPEIQQVIKDAIEGSAQQL